MVSTDDIDRLLWCQNLYVAHFTLIVTFSNTAVFSHTFRSVLVRFADRGLVLQGRHNLKLFSQLFWLILVPYCFIGLMMAPLMSIANGRFAQKFVAKICILPPGFKGDFKREPQQIMQQAVVPMVVPLLNLAYCQYLTYKVRKYFRATCPNQKMFSFGMYRRNFITFEENVNYIQIHVFYWMVFNLVLTGSQFSLTPEKMSWLQNSLNFFYFDIFHGLFLPTKMTIPRNVNVTKPFWQTEHIPEPRRSEQIFDFDPVSKSVVGPFVQLEEMSGETSKSSERWKTWTCQESMDMDMEGQRWATRHKSWDKSSLGKANLHLVTVEIH